MTRWLQQQWLKLTPWHILLLPISWLFGLFVWFRKKLYETGALTSKRLPVPVIVVGNISVGGTGKTPFVIWLAEQLRAQGHHVGIISRGYGGNIKQATEVFAYSRPEEVGDEPVLIARRTNCPIFVGADRVEAGLALLKAHPQCDVIISDDGLQHYRLQRDIEIALVNSSDAFGNQQLMPAGPLREKMSRLQSVDAIVDGGANFASTNQLPPCFSLRLHGSMFECVNGQQDPQPASYFFNKDLVAIAGIGKPERFFKQLGALGLQFERQAFADHHAYTSQDLAPFTKKTLLMTEKDAVKCRQLVSNDAWCLPVKAEVASLENNSLIVMILQKLKMTQEVNDGC